MNTINNKRKKDTIEKIEKSLLTLLKEKDLKEITVTDICTHTKINRSTFYSNFIDIFSLANEISKKIENQIIESLTKEKSSKDPVLNLFNHIYNNKNLYITFFKLREGNKINFKNWNVSLSTKLFDDFFTDYHIEFFESGINGLILKWIETDFILTPNEMNEIIKNEYKSKEL